MSRDVIHSPRLIKHEHGAEVVASRFFYAYLTPPDFPVGNDTCWLALTVSNLVALAVDEAMGELSH